MKNTMILLLTSVTLSVTSQIKVFSGGTQAYGSTTAPAYGEKHHFAGDLVVSEAGNTSAGCVLLRANGATNASSASRPDFSWLGNNNTGIFHPASNTIGFTINGTEKWRVHTNGQLLSSVTMNQSTPDYSFNGDPNTGMYNPAADVFGITTGGTERARVSSLGNLLVGTTSEFSARLVTSVANNCALAAIATHTSDNAYCQINYVNRDLTKAFSVLNNVTGSYVETYTLKGSGDVWVKSTTNWSDRNLKENIDTLYGSLSKLKQLKGVKYNFKASFVGPSPAKTELGLIAQDVEQVLPEVVNTNENGIKGIVYHSIIPVLIEAIKELDAKNQQLQNEINSCCSKASDKKSSRLINPASDNTGEEARTYLEQNKPNPFNKETIIEYNIIESGSASILFFDMNGKLLKTIPAKIPGKGSISINANDFQPGMYYYSLIVNDTEIDTKKMILTQ